MEIILYFPPCYNYEKIKKYRKKKNYVSLRFKFNLNKSTLLIINIFTLINSGVERAAFEFQISSETMLLRLLSPTCQLPFQFRIAHGSSVVGFYGFPGFLFINQPGGGQWITRHLVSERTRLSIRCYLLWCECDEFNWKRKKKLFSTDSVKK